MLDISHRSLPPKHSLSLGLGVLNPNGAVLETLLVINLATLSTASVAVFDPSLPSGNSSHEHLLNILERLSSRLGEQEERVDSHGETEDTEDDVDAPLDVDESGWDEVGEGEVEDPGAESVRNDFKHHKQVYTYQLDEVATATAFPRMRRGKISGG